MDATRLLELMIQRELEYRLLANQEPENARAHIEKAEQFRAASQVARGILEDNGVLDLFPRH